MTKPTGRPNGRPPGAKNKRTMERETRAREAAEAVEAVVPGAFEGDAHAFLMAVYKDPSQPMECRLDAAKAAIRYEKPALASIDVTSQNDHFVYTVSAEPLSEDEWAEKYATQH